MRALIWPTFSFAGNVLTDSLYILSRMLVRHYSGIHWYLVVPDWDGKFPHDDLDDTPWCTKIPVPMSENYRVQEALADPATVLKYGPAEGSPPVEIAILETPQRALNVANAWSVRMPKKDSRPVIVSWDLLARDDRGMEYAADEIELMQMAAGMAVADFNMHEAPITEWMAKYNARKYLSPSHIRKVLDTSRLYELGMEWERLGTITESATRRDRFSVYYGGRFAESKRFGELSDIADLCYRFGRDLDFVVCTGSLSGISERKLRDRVPQIELHIGTNQDEAWAIQQTCHAAICFSRGELFGMSFWEQIGGGLAVIMKRERWNEDMLPEDYPLFVDSKHEALALLRQLYNEFEDDPVAYNEKYSWQGRWAKYVRDRYSMRNMVGMVDEIAGEVERRREVDKGRLYSGDATLIELSGQVTDGVDRITWSELLEGVRQAARIGRNVIGTKLSYPRSNAMIDLYRAMIASGWSDDVLESEPTFVRQVKEK